MKVISDILLNTMRIIIPTTFTMIFAEWLANAQLAKKISSNEKFKSARQNLTQKSIGIN